MKLLKSSFFDRNINHIFNIEIKAIWDFIRDKNSEEFVFLIEKSENSSVDVWRKGIISCLIERVYVGSVPQLDYEETINLSFGDWIASPGMILDKRIDSSYLGMAEHIRRKLGFQKQNGGVNYSLQT